MLGQGTLSITNDILIEIVFFCSFILISWSKLFYLGIEGFPYKFIRLELFSVRNCLVHNYMTITKFYQKCTEQEK